MCRRSEFLEEFGKKGIDDSFRVLRVEPVSEKDFIITNLTGSFVLSSDQLIHRAIGCAGRLIVSLAAMLHVRSS